GSPYAGSVTPSSATGGTFTASNYDITYVSGKITVNTTPLTITADDVTKTYGSLLTGGAGLTTFNSTPPSGLKNGETVGTATIAFGAGAAANASVLGSPYAGSVTPSSATGGTFTASNYDITYVSGKITVNTAPLTITADDVTKTYGTLLTGGAESTAFKSTPPSGLKNGETVETVTIAYGTGSAATASVAGSPYTGSVTPSAATGGTFNTSNYNITYAKGKITVTPLNDCSLYAYNGTLFANTDVGLTYTTVNLSVVVTTTGGADASTATVNFSNTTNPLNPISLGAGTVTAINFNQAIYSYPLKIDIGNNLSLSNQISWTIGGNFSNTYCAELSTEVTVSTRTTDFVTGGGFVVMGAGGNASAGTYSGGPNTKTNFGFNVKWNKTLSNIQGGGFNAIVRTGTKTYQIKAAKVLTLVVSPRTTTNPATAAFTSGNAIISDAVTGLALVTNCNLTVELTDACEPGAGGKTTSDQIAITLKDSKGIMLYYSNNWATTKTAQQYLGGGNLQVQSAANTAAPICGGNTNTVASLKNDMPHNSSAVINNNLLLKDAGNPLSVKVYPNPSVSNFNLQMTGGSNEKLDVKVTDVLGHLVGNYKMMAGASMTIGDSLRPGIYIVQVKQGDTYKFYRIYKTE
ncbi:MAG: pknD 4, partial [Mucilaginibacter sp.]|nr:pknD 4 [Mucilaginibacter sp.]